MDYHLLREKTDGANEYVPTGEILRGSIEDAVNEAVRRTQAGVRTAIYVFDSVNRRPIEMAAAEAQPAPPPPADEQPADEQAHPE